VNRLFPLREEQCYKITMIDPLAPTAGLGARLLLAGGVIALMWLIVGWALA
jgi:hypothetical protein